jgi:asparagine synthase (glutamine-hydrolysing)
MYYSLECRSPLLDHELVEFALRIPSGMKRNGDVKKWILKEILLQYIPAHLVHRKKWGFSIPLGSWLKTDLRYLVHDYLNKEIVAEMGVIDPRYTEDLKKKFFGGDDYLFNRVWVLVVLHKWLKQNAG